MQPTAGVIFDMDGVLIDSADPHKESWRQLAAENGAAMSDELFAATFGRRNQDIIPMVFGEVTPAQFRVLAHRKEAIFRDLVRDAMPVVPGAVELIRGLHAGGFRLAVGSSGPRANIDLALEKMGVREAMSGVVTGEDVTRGKPDPQVFQLAAQRIGLPPDGCVVVEDAPAGVEAGHAAGARTVAVLIHHPREAFPEADLCVEKLGDLDLSGMRALLGM